MIEFKNISHEICQCVHNEKKWWSFPNNIIFEKEKVIQEFFIFALNNIYVPISKYFLNEFDQKRVLHLIIFLKWPASF